MIDESRISDYYDRHARAGFILSDVRFAFHLTYLALGREPGIFEPEAPIIRIPKLFRFRWSMDPHRSYDYRDLLLDLCNRWLRKNETIRRSRQTLTLNDLLAAIVMWRSHLGFTGDWKDSDSDGLASIATVGALDPKFVEVGKRHGFLPNANGGLKLAWDYPREKRFVRLLETVFLLQLARREMLSPEEYGLRFHPGADAAVLGCVLEIIAQYSAKPVTQEVIRPADELCSSSDADDIWLDISRSLPKRTGYRFKRRFQQLNGSDDDPSPDNLSVFRFVRLVLCNLDMLGSRPNYTGDGL